MRNSLAAFLILAGALLTFPAVIAGWEQRVLMNQDRFVDLGTEILEDPVVQDAVAQAAAREVLDIAAANDADGVVSEAEARTAALAIVETLPNSELGQTVLRGTHSLIAAAIEGPSESVQVRRDRIVLDLKPVLNQVIATLSFVYPDLMGSVQLPDDAGEITVLQESQVGTALRAARWFNDAAIYIVILPVIVFAVALLVASNRRLALIFIGIAVMATSIFRIVLLKAPLESLIVHLSLDNEQTDAVVRAVYTDLADTFVAQDLLVAAAGAALLVVGIGLTLGRRLWL